MNALISLFDCREIIMKKVVTVCMCLSVDPRDKTTHKASHWNQLK